MNCSTQRLRANGRANDIDDGVGRADLVKVDLLEIDVVNLGFGRPKRLERSRWPVCLARLTDAGCWQ